jgi:hypothetical protein
MPSKLAGGKTESYKIVPVASANREFRKKSPGRILRAAPHGPGKFLWLSLCVLLFRFPVLAQSPQPPIGTEVQNGRPGMQGTPASASQQLPEQRSPNSIGGTVLDPSGSLIAGARVRFVRSDQSQSQEAQTGADGQFVFANIAPGPFRITITAPGFAPQTSTGTLHSGEIFTVPQITLAVATNLTEVRVTPSQEEVAEIQIKEQEKQRVLGFIPNFYVSYIPNAAPLTPKQKFELAWKTSIDPVTFALTGAGAGIEQALNQFGGYGQGAQGYGKRYGAAYGDLLTSTFIGAAILPSLLKQDPRYFYKGTGTKRSRFLYAIANSVTCKGDNGRWQPNYSAILGSIASGGISNLYYPPKDRGAGLVLENTVLGIGATAAANVMQEFIVRKFTPHVPNPAPSNP